MTSCVA